MDGHAGVRLIKIKFTHYSDLTTITTYIKYFRIPLTCFVKVKRLPERYVKSVRTYFRYVIFIKLSDMKKYDCDRSFNIRN